MYPPTDWHYIVLSWGLPTDLAVHYEVIDSWWWNESNGQLCGMVSCACVYITSGIVKLVQWSSCNQVSSKQNKVTDRIAHWNSFSTSCLWWGPLWCFVWDWHRSCKPRMNAIYAFFEQMIGLSSFHGVPFFLLLFHLELITTTFSSKKKEDFIANKTRSEAQCYSLFLFSRLPIWWI